MTEKNERLALAEQINAAKRVASDNPADKELECDLTLSDRECRLIVSALRAAASAEPVAIYQTMTVEDPDTNPGLWMDTPKDVFEELRVLPDIRSRVVYTHPAPAAACPTCHRASGEDSPFCSDGWHRPASAAVYSNGGDGSFDEGLQSDAGVCGHE